ncbi:MAG: DUF488 family protein [Alphaproteobacteria bacterium]|nr:DUF488 family protein [Alphaproteobacteria bacterium]
MRIVTQRVYDTDHVAGYRVLVDRLWPRGLSKAKAGLDEWCKETAPSEELRRWYGHDAEKWREFRQRYLKELRANREAAADILKHARKKKTLVLLYGAKDEALTHARVLKEFLQKML